MLSRINTPTNLQGISNLLRLFFVFWAMPLWSQVPVGTSIENVARYAYHTLGGIEELVHSDTTVTVVAAGHQVSIMKTTSTSVVTPGDSLFYHITLHNSGNIQATDITIRDTLDDRLTHLESTPPANINGQVLVWTLPELGPGETQVIELVTDLDHMAQPGAGVLNQASFQIDEGEIVISEPVSITVGDLADLWLTKSVDRSTAVSLDTLTYTLQVINIGNVMSTTTYLRDDLPDNLELVEISGSGNLNAGIITWIIGDLAPGDTITETVLVSIPELMPLNSTVNNIGSVSNSSGVTRTSIAETQVNPYVISFEKSAPMGPYAVGDSISYTLLVENDSDSEIYDVIVVDTLQQPLELVETIPPAQIEGNIVSWYLGTLDPFSSQELEIIAQVGTADEALSTLINQAHIQTINGGNNQDTAAVRLLMFPQLVLEKQVAATVIPGETLQYTLQFGNIGLMDATAVTLVDSLPDEVNFIEAEGLYNYDATAHVLTWDLNTLLSESTDSVKVTTEVIKPLADQVSISNTAWLISNELNSDTVTAVTVTESIPELHLSKTGRDLAITGDTLQYSLDYVNNGTAIATQTILVDSLPPELLYISSEPSGEYQAASHTVQWHLGDLLLDQPDQVNLTTRVTGSSTQLVNQARIHSTEVGDVFASAVTTIRAPQLAVTLSSDSLTVIAGSSFSFHINFQNLGDTTATQVVLIDTLPAFLEFVSAGDNGIYDAASHSVLWNLGDLAPQTNSALSMRRMTGQLSGVIDLEVRVVSPIANNTIMRNTVLLSCAENSQAQDHLDVTALSGPFISLSKAAELEVFPGDTLHYTLNYENIGTDVANNVIITDTLDQRLTFISAEAPGIYDGVNHSLTWNLGNLQSGSGGSLDFEVSIDASLGDGEQVANNAWVISNETHPHSSSWATTNVLPMSMTLDADPRVILGNGVASSTLTARVYSFLGNPAPDGIPVSFLTDQGSIPSTLDTVLLANGVAISSIVADTVVANSITALIEAKASYSAEKFTSDTTEVVFMLGAFEGFVYDYSGNPIEDVTVELIQMPADEVVGVDTSDASGYYLIPVFIDGEYVIRFTLIDENGETIVFEQNIIIEVPENGTISTNLSSISGWIYDELTGEPIIEAGLQVILSSDSTAGSAKTSAISELLDWTGSDTSFTDSTGRYFFTNLPPGVYDLSVNYQGIQTYSDGSLQLNLTQPGVFVANANISLRQSPYFIYKTVDQLEAMVGDTLDYHLVYGAHQSVNDSVTIVDHLPSGLRFIENSFAGDGEIKLSDYDEITNEIRFTRSAIPLGNEYQLDFQAVIQRDVNSITLENRAVISSPIDTSYSYRDTRTRAITKLIFPFLKVTKSVNRRVAEPGDFLTYTVNLENVSNSEDAIGINFFDLIPQGFKYRAMTSHKGGILISDPSISQVGDKQQILVWTISDTLSPGEVITLKYRLVCGLNSPMGYAVNDVYALAETTDGFGLSSNNAQATVEVRPGILSDRSVILGKAFYDDNQNGIQDIGELTQADVELILENGTRVRTDEQGKYSIPNVAAGIHVLRVNEASLPGDVSVRSAFFQNLGNGQSQLLQLGRGLLYKANIPLAKAQIKPSMVSGLIYLDLDQNGLFDSTDATFADARFILDDSLSIYSDSSGRFSVRDILPGAHKLAIEAIELPAYVDFKQAVLDTLSFDTLEWSFTTVGADTLALAVALNLKEMEVALANHATLRMQTKMLTQEFRLLVYKPWSMLLRIGFTSGQATLTDEVIPELRKVGDLLRWQPQLNLDINGHTDDIPLASGGVFADNLDLSLARAQSIQQYLVDEMRIEPARVKASGFGEIQPLVPNDTPEGRALNRRVEMVFYNAQAQDSKYSQLDFEFDINYTGEIQLDSISFNQLLPPGFAYLDSSGKLRGDQVHPIASSDSSVAWSFGQWNSFHDEIFDFAMHPDDFEQIAPTSTVTTYLEYTDPLGQRVITDSLETRLSTLVEELSFNMVLKGTQFDVGSADLKSSAFVGLFKLGEFMTWQPGINIVVEGFTDNRGRLEFNMALSTQRAESVKSYLLSNFDLDPARIQVHGLGPHYPVATNETWQGRSSNRRVEVLVNAVVGEAAIMEIEILREALLQDLIYPLDPFAEEWQDSTIAVNKGQVTSFWVNMIDPVPMDYDQVQLTLDLPDGILSERNGTSRIVLLADLDEDRRIHELIELRSNAYLPEGFYEIDVSIQRLRNGIVVGPQEQRQLELSFK